MRTTSHLYRTLSSIRADASRGPKERAVVGWWCLFVVFFFFLLLVFLEQEEYCNFEMITALSASVGVTIRVSWCRRHRLVGKWWFCAAAWLRLGTVSQQFPEHSVVLVCGSGCLDSHHTLMSASARTVCLFKHLRNINVSFNERLFFFLNSYQARAHLAFLSDFLNYAPERL